MKLIHRAPAPSNAALRRLALVTHAEPPPHGAPGQGALSRGNIRVVVDLGSGPVEVAGTFRFADDRWLVRGMDVTVLIDPARPTEFDVDWATVGSMADRVAANDPALADPFGAGRRVAQALGLTREDTGTRRQDRFAQLMTAAAAAPAVPGKVHAVVLIATIRGRMEIGGSDAGPSTTEITVHRNSEAVLAVNVPGRPPYAVLVGKFKFARRQSDISGGGLPALVSATDPNDVEVRWDDVPPVAAQLADRMSASMSAAQDRMARQQSLAALAPQMREMMIDNLRRTLRYVADPAQRQMILDQYRALGVDIDAEGLDG